MNTEVEKKFQPTEEQKKSLLEGAEFLGIENNHDIYFDKADFSFLKEGMKLRKRNGSFELKIKTASGSNEEINDIKEIEEYFQTDNLERYIKEKELKIIADYNTERHIYKKDGFSIHDDTTDFGHKVCEVERLFKGTGNKEKDDATARMLREEIVKFATQYGWEIKKMVPKWAEYLKSFNPEGYNEIFIKNKEGKGRKENKLPFEIKMK